jgi:outer membrane protein assembly factor BamD
MKSMNNLRSVLGISLPLVSILIGGFSLQSCGGSSDTVQNLSAQERYQQGMKKIEDNDYFDAINDFNIVKLQYPGSNVADSAQYMLAECRLRREEYLLAAEEYTSFRKNYPSSSLDTVALYKVALCYYYIAPKVALDQKYSKRAIDEFQAFIEYYPASSLVKDAEEKISELNDRLAQRDYDDAELYMRLEYFKAATHYYDNVIDRYHDTKFAEPALLGKIKSLVARKRYDDAKENIEKFLVKYPHSIHQQEIEAIQKTIADATKPTSDLPQNGKEPLTNE